MPLNPTHWPSKCQYLCTFFDIVTSTFLHSVATLHFLCSALIHCSVSEPPLCPTQVLSVFRKVFGEDFEPYSGSREFHITPLNLQVSHTTWFYFSEANVLNCTDKVKDFLPCFAPVGGLLCTAAQRWSPCGPGPPTVHHTPGTAAPGIPDEVCGEGLDDHTGRPHG